MGLPFIDYRQEQETSGSKQDKVQIHAADLGETETNNDGNQSHLRLIFVTAYILLK